MSSKKGVQHFFYFYFLTKDFQIKTFITLLISKDVHQDTNHGGPKGKKIELKTNGVKRKD